MSTPSTPNPSPSPAGGEDYKYWAFISYSHADAKWAGWLHKQLETFAVPRALAGRRTERGYGVPKRLFPVFRDRLELPGSANLAQNIAEALRQSRYLVVVCSPRSAVSRWVNQEVMAYKAMGRGDRVLCFIVDGEPNATDKPEAGLLECFPPGIRHRVGADGTLTEEREEPIAADARAGKDGRQDALLKVVAGLLGVGFDEVKRRAEARRRRVRAMWGAAAAVLVGLAAVGLQRVYEAQRRAREEAETTREVLGFLTDDLLKQASSSEQADRKEKPNPNLTVREVLQRASDRIGDRFRDRPAVEIKIRQTLGTTFKDLGLYEEAEKHARWVLQKQTTTLAHEGQDTAFSMNMLAAVLSSKGDYAEAEALYRRALAAREKALGPGHPETLVSVNELAVLLQAKGDYAGAEVLHRRALAGREKALGPGHPDTLKSVNTLANLLWAQADYAGAKVLYRQALAAREKALGAEHPDTLKSLNNLAVLLKDQGDIAGAEVLLRRALAGKEKGLGVEHPDTLRSVNGLAVLLKEQGDYAGAEALYRRALAGFEKALGAEHPSTLSSVNNLALLLQAKGDYAGAEALHRRALAGREKALGAEHPSTLSSMNELAVLLGDHGDHAGAEVLHRRALAGREKALGAEHPSTLSSVNNVAVLLHAQGDSAGAEPLYRRALAGREKALGQQHPDTLRSLTGLVRVLVRKGEAAEAQQMHRSALAVLEKASSLAALAAVRYNLACYECLSGNHDEARRLIAEEVAARPGARQQALQDDDLKAIRDFIQTL
jgi:tetratricopeptide (TPR) repeat protein